MSGDSVDSGNRKRLEALEAELQDLIGRAREGLDEEGRREFEAGARRALEAFHEPSQEPSEGGEPEEMSLPGRFGIIGESPPMQKVFSLLERILPSDYPVLVTGESGTGKELVARALHFQGKRRGRPFVSENCAAIPETLLESILFGHAKGSFTGAHRENPGHFVTAHKGTLFLDEVGDMPLVMQGKLLRVLQDGEVRPVGGEKTRKVDVRLVAATNRDLKALVSAKSFREDLYYRLNVLEIPLPPLRERGEDILLLAGHFLGEARRNLGRPLGLDEEARRAFLGHPWPGNVRQLENEVRRAAALSEGEIIRAADLSF